MPEPWVPMASPGRHSPPFARMSSTGPDVLQCGPARLTDLQQQRDDRHVHHGPGWSMMNFTSSLEMARSHAMSSSTLCGGAVPLLPDIERVMRSSRPSCTYPAL